jgi:hypothetical protein
VVTDDDGCTAELVVSVPVGIAEWNAPRFTVWPNPTRDGFEVRFSREFQGGIKLMDLTGRVLDWREVQGMTHRGTLAAQPAGVYLLRAEDVSGHGHTVRMVKQD